MNPKDSFKMLVDGNRRFASGVRSVEAFVSSLKLKELADRGQKPFCIIVTCADSRAPTETLFDRGLGDLFVIRVAGNTVSPALLSGVEYALQYFDIPLCLVLGHTQCGAVQACIDHHHKPEAALPSPSLDALVHTILPEGDFDGDLTVLNVQNTVKRMQKQSELVQKRVQTGRLKVVGGVYDLETGRVEFSVVPDEFRGLLAAA